MSLPTRFGRSTLTTYAYSAASLLVAVVTTPLLVRGLGKEAYGIWVLVGSLVLYLELLEFGFGTANIKFVAHYHATGDEEAVRRAIATSVWILAAPGLLAFVVSVGLAAVLPSLFHLSGGLVPAARVLLLLLALDLAVSIPGDTFGGTLIALQRFDLLNGSLAVVVLAQAAAWVLVLRAGGGLVALGIVTVALSLAGQAVRYAFVRRLVPGTSVAPRWVDRSLARPYAHLSVWYAVTSLADVVIAGIDAVVVGIVVGVPAAAVYAVGQKLAQLARRVISPAVITFFPHAASLAAVEDRDGLRELALRAVRISLGLAGPACITMASLARPALLAWVGPQFTEADRVVVYLAGSMVMTSISTPMVMILNGMGLARVPALIFLGEAAVNLALSIALARTTGLQGVALATLLATSLKGFALIPYACRQLGLRLSTFLWTALRAHAPAAAAALGMRWVLRGTAARGLVGALVVGLAVAATYVAVLAFTGVDREERRMLWASARRRRPVSS